jgi:serine/threonine-protein kinase PknK
LRLPRLAAGVNNERIRLGIQIAPAVADRLCASRAIPHNDGIATLTAELDENSAVRLLAASDSHDDQQQACRRAADLAKGIEALRRPLAALQAELLVMETLTATGRVAEARAGVLDVSARCAEVGLPQLLVDAGLS